MVLKILISLLIVCAAALVAHTVDRVRKRERNKMSFMEAFNLTEMTIVTLFNNGHKLNFLLDTGSNNAYISKSASQIEGLSYEVIPTQGTNVTGSVGQCSCTEAIRISLTYKDYTYNTDLFVLDTLDESFKSIKESDGVQLHGILGTLFLQKHNFVLDFDELIAYKKNERNNHA